MSVNFTENLEVGMEWLHKQGAFLTVKNEEKVNTMTVSWGQIGYQWNRPVFTVLVRKSRYTYDFIENSDNFTVSIPLNKEMKEALTFCGTKSGRDMDKIKECNLTLKESKEVDTPIISECELHYECRIVGKAPLMPNLLDNEIQNLSYKNNDYHTLYFGEIVNCYKL